jgi:hypothetical protein
MTLQTREWTGALTAILNPEQRMTACEDPAVSFADEGLDG